MIDIKAREIKKIEDANRIFLEYVSGVEFNISMRKSMPKFVLPVFSLALLSYCLVVAWRTTSDLSFKYLALFQHIAAMFLVLSFPLSVGAFMIYRVVVVIIKRDNYLKKRDVFIKEVFGQCPEINYFLSKTSVIDNIEKNFGGIDYFFANNRIIAGKQNHIIQYISYNIMENKMCISNVVFQGLKEYIESANIKNN